MKSLRMFLIVGAAIAASGLTISGAEARCARWGETGYHSYRSCVGPSFLYPHHRRCRHGLCLYH